MKNAVILSALLLVLVPVAAHAEPDRGASASSDRRDHSTVAVTAGLLTPTGELGVEYDHALSRHLELAFGAGWSPVSGPQAAIMPRLRARRGAVTYTLGAGLSGGHYHSMGGGLYSGWQQDTNALWANAEAGVQVSSKRGPFVRLYLGSGVVVAHDEVDTFQGPEMDPLHQQWLPYLGVAVGMSF